jgi:hypothetical protein
MALSEGEHMSRRPARFTQADIARAIRAAKQTGAGAVRVGPDGSIEILLDPPSMADNPDRRVDDARELVF